MSITGRILPLVLQSWDLSRLLRRILAFSWGLAVMQSGGEVYNLTTPGIKRLEGPF